MNVKSFLTLLKILMFLELFLIVAISLQGFAVILLAPLLAITEPTLIFIFGIARDGEFYFNFSFKEIMLGALQLLISCIVLFSLLGLSELLLTLISRVTAKQLPPSEKASLEEILPRQNFPKNFVKKIRFVPSDLSIGAFTRGWFFPQVFVSLGLLVAARLKDARVPLILSHEHAHIRHMDRIMLAVPFLAVSIFIYNVSSYLGHMYLWNALEGVWYIDILIMPILLFFLFFSLSKNRELAADLVASVTNGSSKYIDFLRSSTGAHAAKKSSIFHPSLADRIQALEKNSHPLLSFSFGRNLLYAMWITAYFFHASDPYSPYRIDKYGTFQPIIPTTTFLLVVLAAAFARYNCKRMYKILFSAQTPS